MVRHCDKMNEKEKHLWHLKFFDGVNDNLPLQWNNIISTLSSFHDAKNQLQTKSNGRKSILYIDDTFFQSLREIQCNQNHSSLSAHLFSSFASFLNCKAIKLNPFEYYVRYTTKKSKNKPRHCRSALCITRRHNINCMHSFGFGLTVTGRLLWFQCVRLCTYFRFDCSFIVIQSECFILFLVWSVRSASM